MSSRVTLILPPGQQHGQQDPRSQSLTQHQPYRTTQLVFPGAKVAHDRPENLAERVQSFHQEQDGIRARLSSDNPYNTLFSPNANNHVVVDGNGNQRSEAALTVIEAVNSQVLFVILLAVIERQKMKSPFLRLLSEAKEWCHVEIGTGQCVFECWCDDRTPYR